jgi:hypothetical protein
MHYVPLTPSLSPKGARGYQLSRRLSLAYRKSRSLSESLSPPGEKVRVRGYNSIFESKP